MRGFPARKKGNAEVSSLKLFALSLITSLLSSAVAAPTENTNPELRQFAELEARTGSQIGVAAIDISTKRGVDYRANERFLMCSTFKAMAVAAVLQRVDQKKEKLDRFVTYGEAQLLEYAPVTRAHVKEGGMTLEALCEAAIRQSDNTAANLLLNVLGGPKGFTEFARSLGDEFTRLDRMEPELNMGSAGDERDTTTPAAMAKDLQRLFTSDVLTVESRKRLEDWMAANETGTRMIRASVPAGWRVGDKTGRSGKGATNDIAILRPPTGEPIFMAIYTNAPNESSEGREKLVAEVARIALEALAK
nr:ClassA_beta_lactamase [uncultured bacterium]